MPKGMILIEEDRCKGCGLCVEFCPQDMLGMAEGRFNAIGYPPVEIIKDDACTGCELCAVMCPDVVFTVYRQRKKKDRPAVSQTTADS